MATTVDVLQYVLGMDIKGLQANAIQADEIAEQMSNKITASLKRVGTALLAGFGAYKFGDFIKNITLTAARTEELGVVVQSVGKAAGYSNQYLLEQEQVIRSLGITTQASRNIITRLIQSEIDLSYATKIARAAQDLAVIGMMDSSEAAETLMFAISAQQPRLLKQFGIVTDLNNVFGDYAKSLGKTVESLTEADKRQAFLNMVLEQASRVTGTYEAAMTTAGKQLRSLHRFVEEASDAMGKRFLPILSNIVKETTSVLQGIIRLFDPLKSYTDEVLKLTRAYELNVGSADKLVDEYTKLSSKVDKTSDEKERLQKIMQQLLIMMPGLNVEFSKEGDILSINIESLKEYIRLKREELVLKKAGIITDIREAIEDEQKALDDLIKKREEYKTQDISLESIYREQTIAVLGLTDVIGGQRMTLTEMNDAIKKHSNALKDWQLQLDILEGKKNIYTVPEAPGKKPSPPPNYELITKEKLASVELLLKYDKISLQNYIGVLQEMLAKYKLTEEQKLDIKQKIAQAGYEIEKNAADQELEMAEQLGESIKESAEAFKAIEENKYAWLYETRQISLEDYRAFLEEQLALTEEYSDAWIEIQNRIKAVADKQKEEKKKELKEWEEANKYEAELYKSLANSVGTAFKTMMTSARNFKDVVKSLMEAFKDAVINIFADILADWIETQLKMAAIKLMAGPLGVLFEGGGLVNLMQAGGFVRKYGIAEEGEFVMPVPAVAGIGTENLEYMRRTGKMPGGVTINMGGFSFSGMKRQDAYFTEDIFRSAVVEAVKQAQNNRELN